MAVQSNSRTYIVACAAACVYACTFADTYTIIHGAFYERTWQCPLLQMYIIEFSIRLHRDNQKEIFSTIKCNLIQAHTVIQPWQTRERGKEANDRNGEKEKVGGKTIDEWANQNCKLKRKEGCFTGCPLFTLSARQWYIDSHLYVYNNESTIVSQEDKPFFGQFDGF